MVQRNRDGRAALRAIETNVMGKDALNARNATNREKIAQLRYTKETKHYNFGKYINGHRHCHHVQWPSPLEFGGSGDDR